MYSLGVTVCNSSHLNNHCGYLWCRTKCAYLYLGPLPLSAPSTRPTCLPSLCLLLSKALRLKVVQKKGFIEPYSSQKKRTESSLNHQQQDEMEKTNVSILLGLSGLFYAMRWERKDGRYLERLYTGYTWGGGRRRSRASSGAGRHVMLLDWSWVTVRKVHAAGRCGGIYWSVIFLAKSWNSCSEVDSEFEHAEGMWAVFRRCRPVAVSWWTLSRLPPTSTGQVVFLRMLSVRAITPKIISVIINNSSSSLLEISKPFGYLMTNTITLFFFFFMVKEIRA